MANYVPKEYWTRERVDDHLQLFVEFFGQDTIIDSINRMFDIDAAAWFVEQLENDLDVNSDSDISSAFFYLDHDENNKHKYRQL